MLHKQKYSPNLCIFISSHLLRHSWRIWYGESSPALLVSSYTLESSILIWLKYCGAEYTACYLSFYTCINFHFLPFGNSCQNPSCYLPSVLGKHTWPLAYSVPLHWKKIPGQTTLNVKIEKKRSTSSSSPSTGFSSEVCFTKSGMRISSVARAGVYTKCTPVRAEANRLQHANVQKQPSTAYYSCYFCHVLYVPVSFTSNMMYKMWFDYCKPGPSWFCMRNCAFKTNFSPLSSDLSVKYNNQTITMLSTEIKEITSFILGKFFTACGSCAVSYSIYNDRRSKGFTWVLCGEHEISLIWVTLNKNFHL